MSVKTTTLDKIAILLSVILFIVCTITLGVNQKILLKETHKTSSEQYHLQSFGVKHAGKYNYVHCNVLSANSNFYLILERSVNGKGYTVIQHLKGAGSAEGKAHYYSYVDKDPSLKGKVRYRIVLKEIQAIDMSDNKAILARENMFEYNHRSSVSILKN
jgi:hypothetical protein